MTRYCKHSFIDLVSPPNTHHTRLTEINNSEKWYKHAHRHSALYLAPDNISCSCFWSYMFLWKVLYSLIHILSCTCISKRLKMTSSCTSCKILLFKQIQSRSVVSGQFMHFVLHFCLFLEIWQETYSSHSKVSLIYYIIQMDFLAPD